MYAKSSQKKNWTFNAEELASLRMKSNQDYITTHGTDMDVSYARNQSLKGV
jgi:hypothetical protein